MPRSFDIVSSSGSYRVELGEGLIEVTLASYPEALVVCDDKLTDYLPTSVSNPILIRAIESKKSLEAIPSVIAALRERNANRNTHLVVIGGGIIQDICTLAASIYMRGISWTYLPSTMLSMVDSCIGGKSSINVAGYKNLVGNFYPPCEVLVDPRFLLTLDKEMIIGGLFEAVKICYARSFQDFQDYLGLKPGYPMAGEPTMTIIEKSLTTKKWFIETDEFDQKERLLLNFGHTFGHALEAATDFGVSHGIGVGIGMLAAIDYAIQTGTLNAMGSERVTALGAHVRTMLGSGDTAVIKHLPAVSLEKMLQKFKYDKKHKTDHYRVVIPTGDGRLELMLLPRNDYTDRSLANAFHNALALFGYPATGLLF